MNPRPGAGIARLQCMPIVRRGHGSVTLRGRLQAEAGRRQTFFRIVSSPFSELACAESSAIFSACANPSMSINLPKVKGSSGLRIEIIRAQYRE